MHNVTVTVPTSELEEVVRGIGEGQFTSSAALAVNVHMDNFGFEVVVDEARQGPNQTTLISLSGDGNWAQPKGNEGDDQFWDRMGRYLDHFEELVSLELPVGFAADYEINPVPEEEGGV